MNSEIIKKILQETEVGYDTMAGKFSETRKFFWRGLEFISDYVKDGDRVLDYGCGNGRLLELILRAKLSEYAGVDVSQKLIDIAKLKYSGESLKFLKINSSSRTKATNESITNLKDSESVEKVYLKNSASQRLVRDKQVGLPFKDDYFNTVYSIAVFHHLPSKELRAETVKELYRVAKPGGIVIITVWNLWQRNYIRNIFKNWFNKLMGKSDLDWNDCHISFKNNQGEVFSRYHHAFTKSELKKLFQDAGFKIEKCEIINGRNIILIAKK